MTKGIFNPFNTQKNNTLNNPHQKSNGVYDNTDKPLLGDVHLDGIAYVIVLKETTTDTIHPKLGKLMKQIHDKYPKELLKHGIHMVPLGSTYQADPTETVVKTPYGWLIVYVGDVAKDAVEDEAFKRLGHALHQINDQKLLKEHNIEVIIRG